LTQPALLVHTAITLTGSAKSMSTQEMCSARSRPDRIEKNLLTDEQPAIQARMPESKQKQKQTEKE